MFLLEYRYMTQADHAPIPFSREPVQVDIEGSGAILDRLFEELRTPLDEQGMEIGYSEDVPGDDSKTLLVVRSGDDGEAIASITVVARKPILTIYRGKEVPPPHSRQEQ